MGPKGTVQRLGEKLSATTRTIVRTEPAATSRTIAGSPEDSSARLAADLHDTVLQELAAAALELRSIANASTPAARPAIERAIAVLVDQQKTIRAFIASLSRTAPTTTVAAITDGFLAVAAADLTRRHHRSIAVVRAEAEPSLSAGDQLLLRLALDGLVAHAVATTHEDFSLAFAPATVGTLAIDLSSPGAEMRPPTAALKARLAGWRATVSLRDGRRSLHLVLETEGAGE